MFELKNVSKIYTNNGISNIGVQNINLSFEKGECVAITGESGSGKSTLLGVISKIDSFDEGEIYYNGEETSYYDQADMDNFRKNKVGFIFQNYNIIDSYTVLENVKLPLLLKGYTQDEAKKQALKLIAQVGLSKKVYNKGTKLSGGEKQRCVIARALATNPEILCCDEPTGNLDSNTSKEILKLIKELAKDRLVFIVTHNYEEVQEFVTRKISLSDGRIIEDIKVADKYECSNILNEKEINVTKKVLWFTAFKNVISSPKKSILVFLIFLVISFFHLYAVASITDLITTDLSYSQYNNRFDNELFFFNTDLSKVELNKLDDLNLNYTTNNFAGECATYCQIGNFQDNFFYTDYISNVKLLKGNLPTKDDEFLLIIGKNNEYYLDDLYDAYENNDKLVIDGESYYYSTKQIYNSTTNLQSNKYTTSFKLSGVAMCYESWIEYNTFVYGNNTLRSIFNNTCNKNESYELKVNNIEKGILIVYYDNLNESILALPKSYEGKTIDFNITYGVYKEKFTNIVYEESLAEPEFKIGLTDEVLENPYFGNIETTRKLSKKTLEKVNAAGIKCIYPQEYQTVDNNIMIIIMKIVGFIASLNLSIYLIGIFFITYLIVSAIFKSKIKDYEIFRTLGVRKREMAKIVKGELVITGISAMLLSFIIFLALTRFVYAFSSMKSISISTYVGYFLTITIFILLLARRFNRKLFKFSVKKSLEEGDE